MDRKKLLQDLLDSRFGGSQAEFARAIKRSPSQVNQWIAGYRSLGHTAARHIETMLKLPFGWMDGKTTGDASAVQDHDSQSEGHITFDLLEVEAAAGAGIASQDHPEVLQRVNVLESWARREIGGDLKRIRLITASGDSMEPTFHDRDVLFVDESVKDYRGEGVYIITSPHPGGVQAKRLHRLLDGSMRILSDNSRLYDPETITGDDLNRLHICGKVVAAWNFRKV